MKILSIFILSFFLSFPLHASKVLALYFRNDTDENVRVTSIQLKKSSFLYSSSSNEEAINPGGERSFFIEHPEDDFVDTAYVKLELDYYDFITFQMNTQEITFYWKGAFCSQAVSPRKHFACGAPETAQLRIFTVGKARGSPYFNVDNKEYCIYHTESLFLQKK